MESVGMARNEINQEAIEKKIKSVAPEIALLEIITNAIDAWAKNIEINYTLDELLGIKEIIIKDNGEWILYDNIKPIFWNYGASTKPSRSKQYPSQYLWSKWIGRFTFSKIGETATWNTVYEKDGNNYSYNIQMTARDLPNYNYNEEIYPEETIQKTWTTLTIQDVYSNKISDDFIKTSCIPQLLKQEGRRMHLLWVKIFLNWEEIKASSRIEKEMKKRITINTNKFDIHIIKWVMPISGEDSQMYFINSKGLEKHKEHTWLNRNSDEFWHSVFVESPFFDNFSFWDGNLLDENEKNTFTELKREIKNWIRDFRRDFLKNQADKFIQEIEQKNILEKPTSVIKEYSSQFIKETIEELYITEPKIVTKLSDNQKKIFFRMLWTIAETWWETKLFEILNQVLDLSEEEKERFAEILEDISLKNIIKTITIIEDRLKVLSILEQYLDNPELWANEKDELQRLISQHYWIFWEGYSLYANEEDDIKSVLIKLRNEYFEDRISKNDLNFDGENKELDIFLSKTIRWETNQWVEVDNVIVEIKHPSKKLWNKEKAQIEWYMEIIQNNSQLNGESFSWSYILVGTDINDRSSIPWAYNNASTWWELKYGLIFKDPTKRTSIYVRKWCDIIAECRSKMQYLHESLSLRYDKIKAQTHVSSLEEADEALDNSAVLPWVQ